MATSQLRRVIQTLRRATLHADEAGQTDGQLLESYISSREETAFAALVRRHGPMVWGVCRRVLRSHHDAEDAFQATFLVLVRKAASVVKKELVANWLYGVAHQTALKARATTAKRRGREQQVTAMPEPALEQQDLWDDLQPILDHELSRLPDKYRAVIALCDLEGKTRKEAARHFNLPEGTVASRLATARTMLAKRLARHGLAVSGAALAAVLSQQVASASVPISVASNTIQAASVFAAGQAAAPGAISVKAAQLAEGVLKTMLLTKLKIATAVLVVVAVLGAGAATLSQRVLADKPADQPVKEKKEPADKPVKEKKENEKKIKEVRGVVKAVDTEKNTLTVAAKKGENTFTVAKEAHIEIDGKPGKLAGVPRGTFVTLSIFADKKTAGSIVAEAPQVSGEVKAVDAGNDTITINDKGAEKTFTVAKNTRISIDGKRRKLDDLPRGARVNLDRVDHTTVRGIEAGGPWFWGPVVKAVDAEKNTITFDDNDPVTEQAGLAGKTFGVAKDAKIEIDGKPGKLAGLPAGAHLDLTLSADQKTIRKIDAKGPGVGGFGGVVVKSVDAEKNTITVDITGEGEKTFSVAKDAAIEIDGKPGKLAGVPAGANVSLNLFVDRKTARRIQAEGRKLDGVVKAVDAEKTTITVEDKESEKTFSVAKDATIKIDGKPGKLAGVPAGASVSLTLSVDQKTVRGIDAGGPPVFGALVKSVDAEKKTITFDGDDPGTERAGLAGKTLGVAKDAPIVIDGKPGKLAGLPAGANVDLTLSADQKTVRKIDAKGAGVGGFGSAVVKSVNAEKNTITIDINGEGEKTFSVAKDATIEIGGKPGKLADVPVGASVSLSLSVDQKTARRIVAKRP